MPTFIKTGYWEKIQKGYKGWLNLDDLIGSSIGTGSAGQITYWNSPTSLSGGNLYWDSVNNRLTIGAGGFSGDFEINKQSAILQTYRNNNNGVNLTTGASVYQWDIVGQRNGAASTLARMQVFYNGDGITRRGKILFGVAEASGFGASSFSITQTAGNIKVVNIGQNAASYLDNDTTITTTYAQHAQTIIAARTGLPVMSWDIDGVVSNVMMENGNLLLNTTTDVAGIKLNVNGAIRGTQYNLSALNTAPASATATGTLGEIRIDANHIYVCTATNTWKRVAIATW